MAVKLLICEFIWLTVHEAKTLINMRSGEVFCHLITLLAIPDIQNNPCSWKIFKPLILLP